MVWRDLWRRPTAMPTYAKSETELCELAQLSSAISARLLCLQPAAMQPGSSRKRLASKRSGKTPYIMDFRATIVNIASDCFAFREENPNSLTASFRAHWITVSPMSNCCHRSCVTANEILPIVFEASHFLLDPGCIAAGCKQSNLADMALDNYASLQSFASQEWHR